MKKFIKFIAFVLALVMLSALISCGADEPQQNETKTSQKVYNTAFQQATTAVPNSTATITETTAEETTVVTMPTTVKRTGKRNMYKQTSDMRKITSQQLLSTLGAGITLGDSFDSYGAGEGKTIEEYETYLENPVVTAELFEAYAKAGFSVVRIPVSWGEHIDENGNVDELWLDRIEEVVGLVLENGMYCIINSQNDQSWLNTNKDNFSLAKKKFSTMWTCIANRFIDYNDNLIFEGVSGILKADNDKSEPDKTNIKNANVINQAFVDAVRATGKNNKKRHLIVSTYGAFVSSAALDGFEAPSDVVKNRLIAKVDVYVPSSFCLDESKDNIWGSAEDKQYLESVFAMVNMKFSALNMPVIIGEFGVVDKGNTTARSAYAKHLVSTAYNYYMVCFWNDNGSTMKLFDRESANSVQPNIVKSIIESAK